MKWFRVIAFFATLPLAACAGQRATSAPAAQNAGIASVSSYSIDAFSSAVLQNDTSLVNAAIKSGIDINQKDSHGTYPLEQVLPFGNCPMAKRLLDAGADPYLKTADGSTIHQLALKTGNSTLIKIFTRERN